MKIGVSGYHAALVGKIDFFEIDAFDVKSVLTLNQKTLSFSLNANQSFYLPHARRPLEDRVAALLELKNQIQAVRVTLKLTPQFFNRYSIEETIQPLKRIAKQSELGELRLELPAAMPKNFHAHSSDTADPLWHLNQKCKHWKVHGWNEDRWVRRYSQEDLHKLAKLCILKGPETLIFAHSQREIQALEFQKIFQSLGERVG